MYKDWSTLKKLIWLRGSGTSGGGATYQTLTGKIVSFLTRRAAPLKIEATLTPIQDLHGYEAPWPPGGGKNKLNPDDVVKGYFSTTSTDITANDNYITLTIPNLKAGTYTVKIWWSESTTILRRYADGSISAIGSSDTVYSFTTSTDGTFMLCFRKSDSSAISAVPNISVESGSTAPSSFAPYSNECPITGHTGAEVYVEDEYDAQATPTAEITFGQTVYGGTLTVNEDGTGSVVATHASFVWDGVTYPFTLQNGVFVNNKGGIRQRDATDANDHIVICDRFKPKGVGYRSDCTDGTIIKVRGSNTQIACYSSAFASVSDFNASLAENPMTMVYELATPITIPLSPGQVEALQGNNTVWVEDSGEIKVTYRSN